MTSPIDPIFESEIGLKARPNDSGDQGQRPRETAAPELSFFEFACECGARMPTAADLDLHKREICGRRFAPNFKEPNLFVFDENSHGVADGGRRA